MVSSKMSCLFETHDVLSRLVKLCRMPLLSIRTFGSVFGFSYFSIYRCPTHTPPQYFIPCTVENTCHRMHGHMTCLRERAFSTTRSRSGSTPRSTLPHSVCGSIIDVSAFPGRPTIRQVHHKLRGRLTSAAAPQVEAVDDEIFGLSSSSFLSFPLTTDRDILTKKMQTINPQPADATP